MFLFARTLEDASLPCSTYLLHVRPYDVVELLLHFLAREADVKRFDVRVTLCLNAHDVGFLWPLVVVAEIAHMIDRELKLILFLRIEVRPSACLQVHEESIGRSVVESAID